MARSLLVRSLARAHGDGRLRRLVSPKAAGTPIAGAPVHL